MIKQLIKYVLIIVVLWYCFAMVSFLPFVGDFAQRSIGFCMLFIICINISIAKSPRYDPGWKWILWLKHSETFTQIIVFILVAYFLWWLGAAIEFFPFTADLTARESGFCTLIITTIHIIIHNIT